MAAKIFDLIQFCQLVKKNFNGSTTAVVEDVMENVVELLNAFLPIRGDEHASLPNYIENFECKC